jgi:hypothetical protein
LYTADENSQELVKLVEKHAGRIDTLKQEIEECQIPRRRKTLPSQMNKKKKKLNKAKEKLDQYDEDKKKLKEATLNNAP